MQPVIESAPKLIDVVGAATRELRRRAGGTQDAGTA
jgi:hypothetical protein